MLDIFQESVRVFPRGSRLPGTGYTIKGPGKMHGGEAIVYLVPNRKDTDKPFQKGFAASELRRSYQRLPSSGEFSRAWFESEMKECAKGAPCNFLAIGAAFVGLKVANKERGMFTLRAPL
jgi:hypothetical protein